MSQQILAFCKGQPRTLDEISEALGRKKDVEGPEGPPKVSVGGLTKRGDLKMTEGEDGVRRYQTV